MLDISRDKYTCTLDITYVHNHLERNGTCKNECFTWAFLSQEYEVDEWIHGISLATGGLVPSKGV